MKKLVVCMKWGERYGAEYVNRLWRSVRRHVTGEVQLVCFTDDAKGVDKAVDCRPLPAFKGVRKDLAVKPWRKLSLWMADLGEDLSGRDALFLDLDVVVVAEQLAEVEKRLAESFGVKRFPHRLNVAAPDSDRRVQIQTDARYTDFPGRATVREVLGRPLRVAAMEDVLQGKIWAALDPERRGSKRQKDLADIARLIEAYPQLRERVPAEILERLV